MSGVILVPAAFPLKCSTAYDMYLNGEIPITVGGICQHTSDGAVTVRKYIKRLN